MPYILSLDTSSTSCSVALHADGKLVALAEIFQDQLHGARLAVMIQQVLENAGVELAALSAVAVTSGPGSYTGLRIGTSTAKGICFALNIPLISHDSLVVMAHAASKRVAGRLILCPMLDARRMEVYCALYDTNLNLIEPIQAKIIDESSFADVLGNEQILFFGNGAEKCIGVIRHPNARFAANIYPSSIDLGQLAYIKYEKQQFEDLVHFEPIYLKEFLIKKSTKLDRVLNK
jgi:tRNA threonylcarbamoyladenosine biosynthesis protein TsaB